MSNYATLTRDLKNAKQFEAAAVILSLEKELNMIKGGDQEDTMSADRGAEYGDYSKMCNLIQAMKYRMSTGCNWGKLVPAQKEALELIATKIGRILNGNPNNPDSWKDIAGYATLVSNTLPNKQIKINREQLMENITNAPGTESHYPNDGEAEKNLNRLPAEDMQEKIDQLIDHSARLGLDLVCDGQNTDRSNDSWVSLPTDIRDLINLRIEEIEFPNGRPK